MDLSNKLIIKARLGEDDMSLDDLMLMMQRIFRNRLDAGDNITLKYADEVNDQPRPLEPPEVRDIRKEVVDIRDRAIRLLDCLEKRIEDQVDSKYDRHHKDDGAVHNHVDGAVTKHMALKKASEREFEPVRPPPSLSQSREFDPYVAQQQQQQQPPPLGHKPPSLDGSRSETPSECGGSTRGGFQDRSMSPAKQHLSSLPSVVDGQHAPMMYSNGPQEPPAPTIQPSLQQEVNLHQGHVISSSAPTPFSPTMAQSQQSQQMHTAQLFQQRQGPGAGPVIPPPLGQPQQQQQQLPFGVPPQQQEYAPPAPGVQQPQPGLYPQTMPQQYGGFGPPRPPQSMQQQLPQEVPPAPAPGMPPSSMGYYAPGQMGGLPQQSAYMGPGGSSTISQGYPPSSGSAAPPAPTQAAMQQGPPSGGPPLGGMPPIGGGSAGQNPFALRNQAGSPYVRPSFPTQNY